MRKRKFIVTYLNGMGEIKVLYVQCENILQAPGEFTALAKKRHKKVEHIIGINMFGAL